MSKLSKDEKALFDSACKLTSGLQAYSQIWPHRVYRELREAKLWPEKGPKNRVDAGPELMSIVSRNVGSMSRNLPIAGGRELTPSKVYADAQEAVIAFHEGRGVEPADEYGHYIFLTMEVVDRLEVVYQGLDALMTKFPSKKAELRPIMEFLLETARILGLPII